MRSELLLLAILLSNYFAQGLQANRWQLVEEHVLEEEISIVFTFYHSNSNILEVIFFPYQTYNPFIL